MIGLSLSITTPGRAGPGAAPSPAAADPVAWYDVSDLGTLFRDTGGTDPAQQPGDAVALMRDKSGNNADMAQATSGLRPTLGRMPASGARNLAGYSEDFTASVWAGANFTVSPTVLANGVGGTLVASDQRNYAIYNETNGGWIVPKSAWGVSQGRVTVAFTVPASCTEIRVYPIRSDGNSVYRYQTVAVPPGQACVCSFFVDGNKVGGVQVETGNAATAYQKAGSVYDLTEAGSPDLWYLANATAGASLATPSRFGLTANPALTVTAALQPLGYAGASGPVALVGAAAASGTLGCALGSAGLAWEHGDGTRQFGALATGARAVVSWSRAAGSTYGEGLAWVDGASRSPTGVTNPTGVPTDTAASATLFPANNAATLRLFGLAVLPSDDAARRQTLESAFAAMVGG